jgi:hypothetical protein
VGDDGGMSQAMVAAEDCLSSLDPMADDGASTVLAPWGQGLDGAFKTVEDVLATGHGHGE